MQEISAFSYYLRTGRRRKDEPVERKYNHWHDPDDGRFTFNGQGKYFAGGAGSQAQTSPRPPVGREISTRQLGPRQQTGDLVGPSQLNGSAATKLAQNNRNPRIRMRGNGGPPLHDPRTLEQVFPGLGNAPGGAIIGLADNILDLTGPSRAMTTEFAKAQSEALIREIQSLNPNYRADFLEPGGFPSTVEGQANLINRLRLERASVYYQKGDHRPLQIETLRFIQRRVDAAYELGLQMLKNGQLRVGISEQLALGNFVDQRVRRDLRNLYNELRISIERGQLIQVNRRAYHIPEGSYSRPDSRVGNISFDWSLEAKNAGTPQVRNFFRSAFRPDIVVIIRPRQVEGISTYAITKPSGR